MRISRVQIENYRNLKKVDVNLGKIVTLIGENNSGKSNFLSAITLPLTSDDGGGGKHLSWYDINTSAKNQYYAFLAQNKQKIIDGEIAPDDLLSQTPTVTVRLDFTADASEHYDIKDILCEDEQGEWVGSILYRYSIGKPEELLQQIKGIFAMEEDDSNVQLSLLPMELYTYHITTPGKNTDVSYDLLSRFRSVILPAERDGFAASADKLGSRSLTNILQSKLNPDAQAKIERKYNEFFNTVRQECDLDKILNWQEYSDIPNAKDFFDEISMLPNMPPMRSILGSVRLGYADEGMFMQGLGYRNLILLTVLLNSYLVRPHDISLRVLTIEEPEAHLCNSNILLLASLFNVFSKKNGYTQIIYSTHNSEFVNKIGIDSVVVFHGGDAFNLNKELGSKERDYLAANPNTDIFKLLYSRKTILVEGITEELFIKSYLQTRSDLNDIKVLSFHKGFKDIIKIWKRLNVQSHNKLGVVRDYDNEPKAQKDHEELQDEHVIVQTTKEYTLETEIVNTGNNYELLKKTYGDKYGWSDLTADELQAAWRKNKSDIMLTICHDLASGDLKDFSMPAHIQAIIDFMQGEINES